MGIFGSVSAGFEQGRIKARQKKEREHRKKLARQQKQRKEDWNNPSPLAEKIGSAYETARPIGAGAMCVGSGLADAIRSTKPKPAPTRRRRKKKATATKKRKRSSSSSGGSSSFDPSVKGENLPW